MLSDRWGGVLTEGPANPHLQTWELGSLVTDTQTQEKQGSHVMPRHHRKLGTLNTGPLVYLWLPPPPAQSLAVPPALHHPR